MNDKVNVLYSTEDYDVTIEECRDPAFPHDVHLSQMYVVTNRETGVVERELPSLPASYNWADGLQDALDQHRAQNSAEQELFPDTAEAPTVQ